MKHFILTLVTFISMAILCGCEKDHIGQEIGDLSDQGSLTYYQEYKKWGLVSDKPIIDSKIIYLILNPDGYSVKESGKVEFSGKLFECKKESGSSFVELYFIELETFTHK